MVARCGGLVEQLQPFLGKVEEVFSNNILGGESVEMINLLHLLSEITFVFFRSSLK
jgi:hypothetical protein